MYLVKVNDKTVKEYKFKTQAIIYCFLSGYVSSGRGYYFLNPLVKIVEEQ